MAIVGEVLAAPEAGWKRYDDTNPPFKYSGTWVSVNDAPAQYYMGSGMYSAIPGNTISFDFIGDKIRFVMQRFTNRASDISVTIDGMAAGTYTGFGDGQASTLVYENIGLSFGRHKVVVTTPDTTSPSLLVLWDAVDINSNGRLLHVDEVTDPKDLALGKRIRCHYKAASAAIGSFYGLGFENSAFLSPTPIAAPDGDFYFLCVEYNSPSDIRLVADRNLQISVAANTLNTAGAVVGLPINYSQDVVPAMLAYTVNGITVSVSSEGTSRAAWQLFDNNSGTGGSVWSPHSSSPNAGWVKLDLGPTGARRIEAYTITLRSVGFTAANGPKVWDFYGSNDGITWVMLDSRPSVTSWTLAVPIRFTFSNSNSYRYFMWDFKNSNGAALTIQELELLTRQSEGTTKTEKVTYTVRHMTAGPGATDTDNEWYKYIQSSSLAGTITPGDNAVWNWGTSIRSMCHISGANVIIRGGAAVNTYATQAAATASATVGYRPLLILGQEKLTKYLIQDGSKFYSYTPGNAVEHITDKTGEAMFQDYGADNPINWFNDSGIPFADLSAPKLVAWSEGSTQPGTTGQITGAPNPQLIKALGDIDIGHIASINSVTLTAMQSGGGVLGILCSLDQGATWQTWNGTEFINVNTINLAEVKAKAMTPARMNALRKTQWEAYRNGAGYIRFAYYLELPNTSALAEDDMLTMTFDSNAIYEQAALGKDYNYGYTANNRIQVKLQTNGSFTINY